MIKKQAEERETARRKASSNTRQFLVYNIEASDYGTKQNTKHVQETLRYGTQACTTNDIETKCWTVDYGARKKDEDDEQ